MSKGKVYLVGAGPGDPGLITVKGYQSICRADVILYDHLIPGELLKLADPSAEIVSVGKFAGRHTLPQGQINALMVEKARSGKVVVRLKGGDPYLFGRGGEEAQACAEAGLDFEVVPGVTSALAAPCYAGVPPTHRDYTHNVAIVTGHRKDESQIEIPKAGTIIFLMSVANIHRIIASLRKAGWPADTKIAAVERGTCYDQRVITGTLEGFGGIARKAKLKTPAVFIVGKVVGLREKLNWFEKAPNVLVLGNHPERYYHLGRIVHRRMIDCVRLQDYSGVDSLLRQILGKIDWIVFTSINGARFCFERLHSIGADARALASAKVAAIGESTARRLLEFGIVADMVPKTESSSGLLEEFGRIDIKGSNVLLPQAQKASKELQRGLAAAGAVVHTVAVYKTVEVDPGEIDFDHIDQILFTSGSTVRAFVNRFGTVPPNVTVRCLGQPTWNEARKHGIRADILNQTS